MQRRSSSTAQPKAKGAPQPRRSVSNPSAAAPKRASVVAGNGQSAGGNASRPGTPSRPGPRASVAGGRPSVGSQRQSQASSKQASQPPGRSSVMATTMLNEQLANARSGNATPLATSAPPSPCDASSLHPQRLQSLSPRARQIQVAIRARPLNEAEMTARCAVIWQFNSPHLEELEDDGQNPTGKSFTYDAVFGPDVDTAQIYDAQCRSIVQGVLDGYNGTCLAYGQTSSGKTFTFMGDPAASMEGNRRGVMALAIEEVFELLRKSESEWDVQMSFLELYNETITDLLQPDQLKARNLRIVEDKEFGPNVKGLTEIETKTAMQCMEHFSDGVVRRRVSSTEKNAESSRSHAILRLRVEMRSSSSSAAGSADGAIIQEFAAKLLDTQQRLHADRAYLYLVDRQTRELYVQVGDITLRLPIWQGVAGIAATSGVKVNITDAYKDRRLSSAVDEQTGYSTRSILAVPLHEDKEVIGVVQFINKLEPPGSSFTAEDEKLVEQALGHLTPGIAAVGLHCGKCMLSRLTLVDLSGSERLDKLSSNGSVIREAACINTSLLMLGTCISLLSENSRSSNSGSTGYVPFRNSKLTHLLSNSLGGNSQTGIICTLSPSSRTRLESNSTLLFASRAKNVVNSARRNMRYDLSQQVAACEAEIARLKSELQRAKGVTWPALTFKQASKLMALEFDSSSDESSSYFSGQHHSSSGKSRRTRMPRRDSFRDAEILKSLGSNQENMLLEPQGGFSAAEEASVKIGSRAGRSIDEIREQHATSLSALETAIEEARQAYSAASSAQPKLTAHLAIPSHGEASPQPLVRVEWQQQQPQEAPNGDTMKDKVEWLSASAFAAQASLLGAHQQQEQATAAAQAEVESLRRSLQQAQQELTDSRMELMKYRRSEGGSEAAPRAALPMGMVSAGGVSPELQMVLATIDGMVAKYSALS